jgi:hypothetical protein
MPDDLQSRVARLALSSADREAGKSARLRGHFHGSEFEHLYRDLEKHCPGVRIVYFKAGADSFGTPHAHGVVFSDPPPQPLKGRR